MNNNNENEKHKSGLNVEAKSFNMNEPLDDEQRVLMYKEIVVTMERFRDLDTLYDKRFPKDIPDRNVKRAFAMAAQMAEFVVEFLEENGCCINMDSAAMQGTLTSLLLPGPIIACDAIQEVENYIKE